MNTLSRLIAGTLSLSLALLAPGPQAYAAAAAAPRAQGARVAIPSVGMPMVSAPLSGGNLALPASSLKLSPSLTPSVVPTVRTAPVVGASLAAPTAKAAASAVAAPVSAPAAKAQATAEEAKNAPAAARRTAESVSRTAAQVAPDLEVLSNLGDIDANAAHGAGTRLESALTGQKARIAQDGVFAAAPSAHEGSASFGAVMAKPAGDSIRQAAQAQPGEPNGPVPPVVTQDGDNGGRGGKGPLLPKIVAAAIALTPAAFVAWPLIAAGSFLYGGLVIASSLGVASMAFMTDSTPKLLRSIPGFALAGLGAAALVSGLLAMSGPVIAMGAMVTLGGYGFIRFGRKGQTGTFNDSGEIIATFFGALAATAGAGLVLLGPVGIVGTVVTYVAYPATLALMMHLPGWVGEGLSAAFRNVYHSVRAVYRTMTSLRRDTSLYERLNNYSEAALNASIWNAIWVGLVLWLPVLVSEAIQAVLAGAVGLAVSVFQAPMMFAWGALHKLAPKSAFTVRVAEWNRATFELAQGSKVRFFNPIESKLLPWVESSSLPKRMIGALGIRGAQLVWLVAAALTGTVGSLVTLARAFVGSAPAYDPARHDPDSLTLAKDPLPSQVPTPEKPKVTVVLPGKLVAVALGLAPLYFYTLPMVLVGAGIFGAIVAAMGLSVAAMPLMPSRPIPGLLRRLPATLLTVTGGYALFEAGKFWLLAGLPGGLVVAVGALALFSGLGLGSMLKKLQDEKTKAYEVDEGPYILGYASALAVATALVVALTGGTGIVANILVGAGFVLSPVLLYHLPKWLWAGVGASIMGFPHGVSSVAKVTARFWSRDTRYFRNLGRFYSKIVSKSWVYGIIVAVPAFVTHVAFPLVQYALALAFGILAGIARVPTLFAWGASYNASPEGRWTKFWGGFHEALVKLTEGSKKTSFDPLAAKIIPALDEAGASGFPTLKATGALIAGLALQAYWLIRLAVLLAATPLVWAYAAVKGFAASKEAAPAEGEPKHPTRPGDLLD